MNKTRIEFCQYMSNRINEKLLAAEEYELLCFTKIGIKLCLRQSDILQLKWSQFDFKNKILKDVELIKFSNQAKRTIIESYELDNDLISTLKMWLDKTNDETKVFPNLKRYECSKKIGELIGDYRFSGHDLRSIGTCLKAVE